MGGISLTRQSLRLVSQQAVSGIIVPPAADTALLRNEVADIIVNELGDAISTEGN